MKLKHVGVLQRQKKKRSHHKQKYRKTKSVRPVRHRKSSVVWDVWKKKKKKKAGRELMPTPITRLRVRPLIGQTEMFPPVTKSHHPSVKHTQSTAYRFTHYSYILTCRSQTVLQRSNANMGAGVPLRERHDSPRRPIPGIIMPLHFSGHQIVKTQRNKERRSCLVDKLQQREIRCFRCV